MEKRIKLLSFEYCFIPSPFLTARFNLTTVKSFPSQYSKPLLSFSAIASPVCRPVSFHGSRTTHFISHSSLRQGAVIVCFLWMLVHPSVVIATSDRFARWLFTFPISSFLCFINATLRFFRPGTLYLYNIFTVNHILVNYFKQKSKYLGIWYSILLKEKYQFNLKSLYKSLWKCQKYYSKSASVQSGM